MRAKQKSISVHLWNGPMAMAKLEHNVWRRLLGTKRHGKAWGSLLARCGRCHHKGQRNSAELAERMALTGRPRRPKCFLAQKGADPFLKQHGRWAHHWWRVGNWRWRWRNARAVGICRTGSGSCFDWRRKSNRKARVVARLGWHFEQRDRGRGSPGPLCRRDFLSACPPWLGNGRPK